MKKNPTSSLSLPRKNLMAVTIILVTLLKQELRLRLRSRNFSSATLLKNNKKIPPHRCRCRGRTWWQWPWSWWPCWSKNYGSRAEISAPQHKIKMWSHLIVVAAEEELDGGDHNLGDLAEAGRCDHVHRLLVPPHVLLQQREASVLWNRNRKSHESKMFLFYNFTKVVEGPVIIRSSATKREASVLRNRNRIRKSHE